MMDNNPALFTMNEWALLLGTLMITTYKMLAWAEPMY